MHQFRCAVDDQVYARNTRRVPITGVMLCDVVIVMLVVTFQPSLVVMVMCVSLKSSVPRLHLRQQHVLKNVFYS